VSKDPYQIIIRPVITEKSSGLKDKNKEVCFEVALRANKIEIKRAIEHLFKVKVDRVRTETKLGKERRVGRSSGKTKSWKKAIVRLKKGEKMIEYFEAT
jgi:large subunit ribosomal protein L23